MKPGTPRWPVSKRIILGVALCLAVVGAGVSYWLLTHGGVHNSNNGVALLPDPVVEVRNGPVPGSVEIMASGPIDLSSELIVEEQLDDGSFKPRQNLDGGRGLKLVTSCDHRAFDCVRLKDGTVVPLVPDEGSTKRFVVKLDDGTLVPFQRDSMEFVTSCEQMIKACVKIDERGLRPVPWSGMSCSSQCTFNCNKNSFLRGRFRFVVTSCDGKSRFEGPVFEMPSAPNRPPTSGATVEVRNGPVPGSVELRASGPIDLSSELIVEKQLDDGSFEPRQKLDDDSMKLVTSCSQRVNACVKIDERGLRPVPWNGMSCISQCNDDCHVPFNWWLSGRFRFVVKSCDGKSRFEGPVFEMPSAPNRPPTSGAAVEVRNGPVPGSVELRASGPIDLSSELIVEKQLDDGSFVPQQYIDGSLKLVTSCDHVFACAWSVNDGYLIPLLRPGMDPMNQLVARLDDGSVAPLQSLESLDRKTRKRVKSCGVSACVRIDERGLRPVPWSGMSCSAQCSRGCDWDRFFSGRFRFVVTSCDGKSRFEGPVFELPDRH